MSAKRLRIPGLILLCILLACQQGPALKSDQFPENGDRERIIIFYTNDEHGWMERTDDYGGAAALLQSWIDNDGYEADAPFLVLSGGDMWTGPAISTLTQGASMVEIMNYMGYDAAALGNHEFDFGLDNLRKRVSEMNFPILAANLRYKASKERPEFVKPYVIEDVGKVKVGIIGLALTNTPSMTKIENVVDFRFEDYANTLTEIVPVVKSAGAELLIVIGHFCHPAMLELAPLASELGITLIGGGHCEELSEDRIGNVTLLQSGSKLQNYVKAEILFDDASDRVLSITTSVHPNNSDTYNTDLERIIADWRIKLDKALTEVIGYSGSAILKDSPGMKNMITDSWLYLFPRAQIAMTNTGGIRQDIPDGAITIETIFGVLPFSNNILELELQGKNIVESLSASIAVAGLITDNGYRLRDGTEIHPDSVYAVLINDFMYTNPRLKFSSFDQSPYDTGLNYRQPVIDWIKSLHTDQQNPLNNYLDEVPR